LSASTANGICDKLPFEVNYTNDKEHFYTQTNNIFIFLNKERANSIEGLKTWLQSNTITIWYELAEPYTEQCNLPVIPSYFPYTNVWHDSPLQPQITWNVLTGRSTILDGLGNLIQEAPMTTPMNKLINGDFQINPRGQSSYVF